MAQDDRISDFPPADALTGAELYAAVQDGVTKKTTLPVMSVLQGTRVRETFRGFVSGSGTLLEQAAASINAGAQFTVQPNFLGIVTFVTNADQFATADSLVTKVSFIIKLGAGTYGSGGTTLTSGFLFQIAPINVEVDSDYYFELGNIGTSTIEDFVNGSGPYIVSGLSVFTATQNGDEKIWLFIGGDGTFGTGATPTTAGMFVDLTAQDPIPVSGGENGQVTFWTEDNLQSGDDGLFWDNTNKRLGIGTTTPSADVQIKAKETGLLTDARFIYTDFAGVNRTILRNNGFQAWRIMNEIGDEGRVQYTMPAGRVGIVFSLADDSQRTDLRHLSGGGFAFAAGAGSGIPNELMRLNVAGDLGINTTNPTQKLDVNGKARIRTIDNATGDVLTVSATGVVQKRTISEIKGDINQDLQSVTENGNETDRDVIVKADFLKGFIAQNDSGETLARMINEDGESGLIEVNKSGSTEKTSILPSIITLVDDEGNSTDLSHIKTFTGNTLPLKDILGRKQTAAPNTSASFTIGANPVLGGNVKVLINRADEPKLPATQITLTGTGGTANITIAGVNYLATFNTDLTTTASDFVTSHAAAILAATGQVVTSSGAVISFLGFGDRVKIANATDDLAGTMTVDIRKRLGSDFQPNTDMYMVVEQEDGFIEYQFQEIVL
jgi:hypothetical protein